MFMLVILYTKVLRSVFSQIMFLTDMKTVEYKTSLTRYPSTNHSTLTHNVQPYIVIVLGPPGPLH